MVHQVQQRRRHGKATVDGVTNTNVSINYVYESNTNFLDYVTTANGVKYDFAYDTVGINVEVLVGTVNQHQTEFVGILIHS